MGRPSEQYGISVAPQFPVAKSEYVVHLDLIQLNLVVRRSSRLLSTSAAATNGDDGDDHDGHQHDYMYRSQTAAFARRWAGLAQTQHTGPVFKF
jgi:hypothetical protein